MRLSRLILLSTAVFSSVTIVVFLQLLHASWRDAQETLAAAQVADVNAAWIEAQTALSVERGLTRIVLDDGRETPAFIKEQLRDQRRRTDELIRRARKMVVGARTIDPDGGFLRESAALAESIA